MKNYYEAMNKDVFTAVPVTFHIKEGVDDVEFQKFKSYFQKEDDEIKQQKILKSIQTNNSALLNENLKKNRKNIWIIKPGENTNRG